MIPSLLSLSPFLAGRILPGASSRSPPGLLGRGGHHGGGSFTRRKSTSRKKIAALGQLSLKSWGLTEPQGLWRGYLPLPGQAEIRRQQPSPDGRLLLQLNSAKLCPPSFSSDREGTSASSQHRLGLPPPQRWPPRAAFPERRCVRRSRGRSPSRGARRGDAEMLHALLQRCRIC